MKNFNKILQWIVLLGAVGWLIYYFINSHRVYERTKTEIQHVAPKKTSDNALTLLRIDLPIDKLTAEDVAINSEIFKHNINDGYNLF